MDRDSSQGENSEQWRGRTQGGGKENELCNVDTLQGKEEAIEGKNFRSAAWRRTKG